MRYIITSLAALSLGFAGTASAQDAIGIGETSGVLSAEDAKLDDGSHYDCFSFTGTPGQAVTVTMKSGEFDAYMVIGTETCATMDRGLSDDDSGGGTDAQLSFTPDAEPVFIRANSLEADKTGAYTLTIAEGGEGAPLASAARGSQDLVGGLLDGIPAAITAQGGGQLTEVDRNRIQIAQGASQNWPVTFSGEGPFVVFGVCDNGCSDVDLTLYDARNKEIDSDVLDDDAPVVTVDAPGRYRVSVTMKTCTTETCEAGVAAFSQN